jgi:hypothetical protein
VAACVRRILGAGRAGAREGEGADAAGAVGSGNASRGVLCRRGTRGCGGVPAGAAGYPRVRRGTRGCGGPSPSASGAKLCVSTYNDTGSRRDTASSVASNPDGARVFVCGESLGAGTDHDYATVAYDATQRRAAVGGPLQRPGELQPSRPRSRSARTGTRVFVTGQSNHADGWPDYATVSYDVTTGSEQWVARFDDGSTTAR